MKLTLQLKPSLLGQFYETECEKSFVYYALEEDKYDELGWDKPVDKDYATAKAGEEWEAMLKDNLEKNSDCEFIDLTTGDKKNAYDKTIFELKNLKGKKKPIYLYQSCLTTSANFRSVYLSKFAEGKSCAILRRMHPDFVQADYDATKGKFRLTVIDAKNAGRLKVGAQIQIALYVQVLKYIIADEGIDNCYVDDELGIVWNRERYTNKKLEHMFPLKEALDELEVFFNKTLVDICNTIDTATDGDGLQDTLDFCISQKCEYCDNFESCKAICKDRRSVRLMPYMTSQAQKQLKELIHKGILANESIESVEALLKSNPDALTQNCRFWRNIKNNLDEYAGGLRELFNGTQKMFHKDTTSISFPKGWDYALILTAQQDVMTGRNYAYAWLLRPGRGIDLFDSDFDCESYVQISEGKKGCPGKGKYYDSVVALEPSDEEFYRVDKVFVESIYSLLKRISEYSTKEGKTDKRKLQCFVMDDYEYENIESALFNMLESLDPLDDDDRQLLEKVMAIIFWLQDERLITDSDYQPDEVVDNPVTVITTEVSRLYVLPEEVSYNIKKTAEILSPHFNFGEYYNYYFGILSNVIEGMLILNIWDDAKAKDERLEKLSEHLRKRLFVEGNMIATIRKESSETLSVWPQQYTMIEPKYSEYPEIAKMDFENRYEKLLSRRQVVVARINGIDNAIDNGSILSLQYTGEGYTYEIINRENYIGREWGAALLCEDTPVNRQVIMRFSDAKHLPKKFFWNVIEEGEASFYNRNSDKKYNFKDDGIVAKVDFVPRQESFKPEKGEKYLLFEVFVDWNSSKTADGLSRLVDRQELLDPISLSGSTGVSFASAKTVCEKYWSLDGYTFSKSQEKAFEHLFEQKLSVLNGPPASGKTDFIARALITLACYYKEVQNKSLKIMVTAMSHSAVDNVLLKLDKMLRVENLCDIRLYKVGRYDDPEAFVGRNVTPWDKKGTVAGKMEESKGVIQVVGMMSWAAYNEFLKDNTGDIQTFDMIVMDEASQIRAMDAFLNLECSDENTRFLLVGDDNQLPPIIHGKYKEAEGEKYIYGSIFHMYLTALGEEHPDLIKLSDNFRMNGIMCKYPAKKIYGETYKAYDEKIAKQRIELKSNSSDELLSYMLDPEYPLVFCKLSGNAREQNAAEIEMVTKLVKELWNNQLNEDGVLAQDAGNFWRDKSCEDGDILEGACGIISPHHEHINRLKTSISQIPGIEREYIFVDTVDKLQGRERKAIIVSYGVSEQEKMLNESEFIFSLNRFNVSLTRGKAKTIVFLSDVIADSSLATNTLIGDDENLEKGIGFIHGFAEYMKGADVKCDPEMYEEMKEKEFSVHGGIVSLHVWKKKLANQ